MYFEKNKKLKFVNHDFLNILMLLYIMLAALSNAVFLHNDFIANAFLHALSWFIDTSFIYFKP